MRFIPFTYIRTNSPVFTMVGNYTYNGGGTPISAIQLKDYTFGITPNFQTDCSQSVSGTSLGNTPIFVTSLCYNGTSATVTRTIKNNGVGKVYQISNSTLSSNYRQSINGPTQYYSGTTISDVITLNYNDTITQSITVPIFYGTNYVRIGVNWDDTITLI